MQPGGALGGFLPLVFIFVIFYFLLIRPQQKRAKDHQKMLNDLLKGDEVVTNGGLHGVVTNIRGNLVDVKIAEDVKVTFSKEAISSVKREPAVEEVKK
ncbi:MAG: preprotein translocase subunit YajC [bacterium]